MNKEAFNEMSIGWPRDEMKERNMPCPLTQYISSEILERQIVAHRQTGA